MQTKVHDYWRRKLVFDAKKLQSFRYIDVRLLSFSSPYPIWRSLDGNKYQTEAALVQAVLLSGRYRTERLCRFWTSNKQGFCLICLKFNREEIEDLGHLLIRCAGLTEQRRRLFLFTSKFATENPALQPIINEYLFSCNDDVRITFLLDCSTLPMVISARQVFGDIVHHLLFKLTRTWCRSIHRSRLRELGRWKWCWWLEFDT